MPSSSAASVAESDARSRSESFDTTKSKGTLVTQAERFSRSSAAVAGYLKKKNSAGKWQKRWFEVVGQYFVYYKSKTSDEMLCALDLWRASAPELLQPDPADPESSADFAITWDRFRTFRAGSRAEASRWVEAMKEVQGKRPGAEKKPNVPATVAAAAVSPARRSSRAGGVESASLGGDAVKNPAYGTAASGKKVDEWGTADKAGGGKGDGGKGKGKGGKGKGAKADKEDGGGCCSVM
jgi:hypothetical protein